MQSESNRDGIHPLPFKGGVFCLLTYNLFQIIEVVYMDQDPLQPYRQKRHFDITSEPVGRAKSNSDHKFVIQKHSARTQHYDFRLEVDGVLKSWAVPKGPSMNPRDRRLAVPTEDHPLDYADFEGIIPEGQYGAGVVLVWDRGTYQNITKGDGGVTPMAEALKKGHVAVWLNGEKLRGGFALTRTAGGAKERWILIKMKDGEVNLTEDILVSAPRSVISDRSIEE